MRLVGRFSIIDNLLSVGGASPIHRDPKRLALTAEPVGKQPRVRIFVGVGFPNPLGRGHLAPTRRALTSLQ